MNKHIKLYRDFLLQHIQVKKPLRVVCDPSNGTTGPIIRTLAEAHLTNISFILINEAIDPEFSAHGPNPLAPNAVAMISEKIKLEKTDFGVIFDADGDRAVFVDNTGMVVPPHISAHLLFSSSTAPYVVDEIVYQSLIHTNLVPKEDLLPTKVGSRFIKEKMREMNSVRGAEYSGHYYFKEFFYSDSGIMAMIMFTNAISQQPLTLAEHIASLPRHFVEMKSIVISKPDWGKIEEKLRGIFANSNTVETRDGITFNFPDYWLSARLSNTEPLLRFTIGSNSREKIDEVLNKTESFD